MTFKTFALAAAALALGTSAQGAVLVGGTVNGLLNALGEVPASPAKTVAVIDVDGDGLAGFDFEGWDGGFLFDADDMIVTDTVGDNGEWNEATGDDLGTFEDPLFGGTNALLEVPTTRYQFDLAAVNDETVVGAGDEVFLFWFPELGIDADSASEASYGVISLGELDAVGGVNVFMYFGNERFLADQVAPVIPEPASLALMGLGALAMLRRRGR